jgi:hypothetical protein
LDKTGLLAKIYDSASAIDQGRKWLDTDGLEHEGRINYRKGLALGVEAFKEAQTHATEDLYTLFIAEYTFLGEEFEFCAVQDTKTKTSLSKAIQDFEEAFLALEVLQSTEGYTFVEKAISHHTVFRYKEMPKDAADLRSDSRCLYWT